MIKLTEVLIIVFKILGATLSLEFAKDVSGGRDMEMSVYLARGGGRPRWIRTY